MKKLICNTVRSLVLIAVGIVLFVLLFKQWVPFDPNTPLGAAIDLVVPYLEFFGAGIAISTGVVSSYFFQAAIAPWFR